MAGNECLTAADTLRDLLGARRFQKVKFRWRSVVLNASSGPLDYAAATSGKTCEALDIHNLSDLVSLRPRRSA